MDDADASDAKIQQAIDDGIARVRRELEYTLTACGVCYWCESPVGPARMFCSTECAQDWQHDRQRKKELGK